MSATLAELQALEAAHAIGTYIRNPVQFVSGSGAWLRDEAGTEYLDFLAGISVLNVGHCHPRVVAAITEQAQRLTHATNLYYTEPGLRLSAALAESSLGGKVFLCNSGTEAVEAAIKLARRARPRGSIVVMEDAFHGRTYGSLSATPQESKQAPFAPLVPGFVVSAKDPEAIRAAVGPDTAAVYVENPNFLGVLEAQLPAVAALARAAGAETIVGVDPISLGLLAAPAEYGADIVVGTTQPLGIHLHAGGGVGGFIATRDEERYAREYPTLQVSIAGTREPGERSFGMTLFHQSSYGSREEGNDWTGNSVYLWAVVNAVYMAAMGPAGFAEIGATIGANSAWAARRIADEVAGVQVRWGGFFKEFVVDLTATGRTVAQVNAALRERGIFGGFDLSTHFPELGQSALFCVTEVHTAQDIEELVIGLTEATA